MADSLGGKVRAVISIALLVPCMAPALAAGDMAEACTALVASLYKQAWPTTATDSAAIHATFESHYSASLGKCFFLESVTQMQDSPALHEILPRQTQRLVDANGKQDYGMYDSWNDMPPMKCWVQQASCGSRQEWTALIDPFMRN